MLQEVSPDLHAVAFDVGKELAHKHAVSLGLLPLRLHLRQLQLDESLHLAHRVRRDTTLWFASPSVISGRFLRQLNAGLVSAQVQYHDLHLVDLLGYVGVLLIIIVVFFVREVIAGLLLQLLVSDHSLEPVQFLLLVSQFTLKLALLSFLLVTGE